MPTVLPQTLAVDRETKLFAKKETTFGVGVKPAAADFALTVGDGAITQSRTFISDAQKRNTFSRLNRFAARYEPGAFSFPIYVKPSGTLGTKPEGAILYEALFGRETVTASTKVEYFLLRTSDTRPSVTLWFNQGHWVYMCWGAVVNQGQFSVKAGNGDDALAQLALSGLFAELRWTGTDELAVAIPSTIAPGETTFTAKDASKFSVGSYLQIGSLDNAGGGFEVTAVNYTTRVVTFTPGIISTAVAVDSVVKPWLPAGTELGNPVHGRLGTAQRGTTNLPLISTEVSLDNKIKFLNEEKNGKDFADRFIHEAAREVQATAEVYFDADTAKYFREHTQGTRADIVVPVGDTAAKRFRLTLKNVELDHPNLSGTAPKVQRLAGPALASTAFDDELVMLLD